MKMLALLPHGTVLNLRIKVNPKRFQECNNKGRDGLGSCLE